MTTAQKSITRVLAELKTIDEKLSNPSGFGAVAGLSVGQGSTPTVTQGFGGDLPKVESEAIAAIKANLNKITGLIDRRRALKAAVVLSNASTFITVAGRTMTVAEAIELKARVSTMEALTQYVRAQVNGANMRAAQLEREVDILINAQVQALLSSSSDKSALSTVTADITKPIMAQKKPNAIVAPATEFVEKFGAEIETLRTEIDFVLSESNAKTVVTV